MGRRTRRLSIAAIASSFLFLLIGGAGLRSLSFRGAILFGDSQLFGVVDGCAIYFKEIPFANAEKQPRPFEYGFLGFSVVRYHLPSAPSVVYFRAAIPLYLPLLLLLIAPIRWLVARPLNAPAFPVITDAKQG